MSEALTEAQPGGPEPGPLALLLQTLISPGRAFASLARRPRWLLAILVLVGSAVLLSVVLAPRMDMEKLFRETAESRGLDLSEEQLSQQLEMAQKFGWIGTASQLVIQPAIYLLCAAVFLALFRMLGSDFEFRNSLAVAVHAFLPFAVMTLLAIPVVLSRSTIDMEEVRGGGFLKSSLAAIPGLVSEDSGHALKAFLGSFDLFAIWSICLLATGYRIVARVSRGAAWGVVLTLWVLFVAGKVALSGLF